MKRAALYMRVSSGDQHPETQLLDLRQQRRVLYDAHRRISTVTKGLQKPAA